MHQIKILSSGGIVGGKGELGSEIARAVDYKWRAVRGYTAEIKRVGAVIIKGIICYAFHTYLKK